MIVNDDTGHLTPLGALRFIASRLAPAKGLCRRQSRAGGASFCPCSTAQPTTCAVNRSLA
ncbi:hypothetical protein EKG40_17480 [Pseudomonas moorei]|nr:hypothetical protein EKG40_17480 [Pseudomonas moorei]